MENPITSKVGQMMTSPVKTVKPEVSLVEAAKMMIEGRVGALVVEMGPQEWGMITEKDIVKAVMNGGSVVDSSKVADFMTKKIVSVEPELPLVEASVLMRKEGVRRLPVVSGGQMVGIVTETDLSMSLRGSAIEEMEQKLAELKAVEQGAVERAKKELQSELESLQTNRH